MSREIFVAGWGARIQEAVLHYSAAVKRRVSLEDFGRLVAEEEGRDAPYRKATVSNWANETNEPAISTFEAMARLVGCDPWWLVWGVGHGPTNVLAGVTHPAPKADGQRAQK